MRVSQAEFEMEYESTYDMALDYDITDHYDLSEYGEYELGGFSKKQKSQKFRQDRNFPAHKKGKTYRRKRNH